MKPGQNRRTAGPQKDENTVSSTFTPTSTVGHDEEIQHPEKHRKIRLDTQGKFIDMAKRLDMTPPGFGLMSTVLKPRLDAARITTPRP
jgi:hypothetical protein